MIVSRGFVAQTSKAMILFNLFFGLKFKQIFKNQYFEECLCNKAVSRYKLYFLNSAIT